MASKKIPAYVEGLWRGWADWIRQDMEAGDLDHWAADTTVQIRSNGKSDGPVLRAMMAMEDAEHNEAGLVHAIYRQMSQRCQRVLLYHYVGDRPLDGVPSVPETTARREHYEASMKLRSWVLGLQLMKGDDEATAQAVERGRKRRLHLAEIVV